MCKKDKAVTKRERKKKTTTAVNIRRGLTSSWPFFLVNVRETVGTNGRTKREGKIKIKERGWRTYAGPTFLFHGAFRCWTNEWTQKKKEPPPPLRTPLVGNEITAPEIVLKSSLVSARAEKVKVITAKKGRKKGGKKKVPLLTDIIHGLKEILWKKIWKLSHRLAISLVCLYRTTSGYCRDEVDYFLFLSFSPVSSFAYR